MGAGCSRCGQADSLGVTSIDGPAPAAKTSSPHAALQPPSHHVWSHHTAQERYAASTAGAATTAAEDAVTPFKKEKETEEEREDGEGDAAADGLTAGRRDEELQRLFGRYKEEEQRHSAQHKSGIVQRTMTTAPTARQGRPPPDDKLSMPADGQVEDQLEDSALEFLHHRPTGSSVVSSPHAPKDSRTTAIVDDVTETDF